MAYLVARYMFRDLPTLLGNAEIAESGPAVVAALRSANFHHPHEKTVGHIVYRAKPVKEQMARFILRAIERSLQENGKLNGDERLQFSEHVVEFDSYLPDLSFLSGQASSSANDPENDVYNDIAAQVGCESSIIFELAIGLKKLVPFEFAEKVAMATTIVCKLPSPPTVIRCPANEQRFKPIGKENGKQPHECEESVLIRKSVLSAL